jgi:hypothetical protein
MRPTYEQLIKLNPLLGKRTPDEVERLLDAIEEYGYRWDWKEMSFYNESIGSGIRTMGLDMHTADTFREFQNKFIKEMEENPEATLLFQYYQSIWSKWLLKIIFVIVIWFAAGWIFVNTIIWLSVLGGLILIMILFWYYCSKGFAKIRTLKNSE